MTALQQHFARLHVFFTRTIWQAGVLADRSLRGRCLAALRVAATTYTGVVENSLPSRAGALSYSSMLALGPLIILIVLFSGATDERASGDFMLEQINRTLLFVAPQLAELAKAEPGIPPPDGEVPEGAPAGHAPTTNPQIITSINPQLAEMLRGLVSQTHSKTIGAIGIVSLLVIVIQLFTSIENAFNGIWGVRRGRNWMMRIVFYWTAITLGAVLAVASLVTLSASTFLSVLAGSTAGAEVSGIAAFMTSIISALILTVLLTFFYKFIPNTSVGWVPAVTGAIIVVALVHLNNTLAFLYIRNVSLNVNVYGGLAVLVVLMLGLYVFWLILLLGGQITYAVQNAHYRGSNMAWADLNHTARMGLAVLVLAIVARRFRACQEAFTAPQIAEIVKIPIQVLNACFMRLLHLGVLSRIPPDEAMTGADYRFQPARPLGSITLAEFKELFESAGGGPRPEVLGSMDPVVQTYFERSRAALQDSLGQETLESLIERLPEMPDRTGAGASGR